MVFARAFGALNILGFATSIALSICGANAFARDSVPASTSPIKALFLADNNTGHGLQPYITDGTSAGTTKVVLPGQSSAVYSSYSLPGKIMLTWYDSSNLYYLAYIDPTGHVETKRFPSTIKGFQGIYIIGRTTYYILLNIATGNQTQDVYTTDGTLAGTKLICTIETSCGVSGSSWPGYVSDIFHFNNDDYIVTYPGGAAGLNNVYKIGAARLSKAFSYGFDGRVFNYETQVGNQIVFVNTTPTQGAELWATDGTNAGKHLVKQFYTGTTDGIYQNVGHPPYLVGGKLLLVINDRAKGYQFAATDGTTAGTVRISNFAHPDDDVQLPFTTPALMKSDMAGKVYLLENNIYGDPDPNAFHFYGSRLYVMDGSPTGTVPLPWVYAGKEILLTEHNFAITTDGWIYSSAMQINVSGCVYNGVSDYTKCNEKLYRYNIKKKTVEVVADTSKDYSGYCRSACDDINFLTAVQSSVVFQASDRGYPGFNAQPWISSGTADTTHVIKSLAPYTVGGSNPQGFTPMLP